MKISDEIRELAGEAGIYSNACGKLRELADRIDRETVELPKDADGVPIHVWDTVYSSTSGKRYIVNRLHLAEIWGVLTWGVLTSSDGFVDASSLTHEFHDSLGRIAEDLNDWGETKQIAGCPDVHGCIAYFAERIRKLAEKEDK